MSAVKERLDDWRDVGLAEDCSGRKGDKDQNKDQKL